MRPVPVAAEAEAYSVGLIGRMLECDTENRADPVPIQARLLSAPLPDPTPTFVFSLFGAQTEMTGWTAIAAQRPPRRASS